MDPSEVMLGPEQRMLAGLLFKAIFVGTVLFCCFLADSLRKD